MKSIFSPHLELAGKVMDLRLQRQNLVVGNLSNVNTPGYKPRRLDFEEQLQNSLGLGKMGQMTRTDGEHVPVHFDPKTFKGDWEKEFKPRTVHGEDSVDMDKEMAILNKNAMLYDALALIVQKGFQGINKAIQDGSR